MPQCLQNKAIRKVIERLLRFRMRSEKEIRDRLIEGKYQKELIENNIKRYKEIHLIDDKFFAKIWTEYRLKKPIGLKKIRIELKTKGISDIIIEDILNNIDIEYQEEEIILDIIKERLDKYKQDNKNKTKEKIYRYLYYRGFNKENIQRVINKI